MRTRVLSIFWSAEKDEATLVFSKDFHNLPWIEQADSLKDSIDLVVDAYNKCLADESKMGSLNDTDK